MALAEKGAGTERILVLNPGSTSTKLAVFEGEKCAFEHSISHSKEELSQFRGIMDQLEYRQALVEKFLTDRGIALGSLAAVVGRGGLMRSTVSGTYLVNDAMLEDVRCGYQGEHASNLGALLAHGIAAAAGVPAFVVDPVVVDELEPVARLSGLPEIPRKSIVHALNVKATARRAAEILGKPLDEVNLIVGHLGGGISVCALEGGRMVDVSSALSCGPMTPERAGSVPTLELVRMCYSGTYTEGEMRKKLVGRGGLVAYLGTDDNREVVKRIEAGDKRAELVHDAMIYQIAKEIGAMATVLRGKIDAVVLTGGLAHSTYVTGRIRDRVAFLGRVILLPGEDELRALALGALRVLRGEERARDYPVTVEGGGA
jgi:butyrate kinase